MLLALLLVSCTTSSTVTYPVCEIDDAQVTPAAAYPGDTVVITATPLTEAWDTAVTFGATRAEIISLDRVGCDACDACVVEYGCDLCDDCDACDALCAADCSESVTVIVPDLSPGSVMIEMFNTHGPATPMAFEVLGAVDTAADDTGGADDSGADDSGADSAPDTAADTAAQGGDSGVDGGG